MATQSFQLDPSATTDTGDQIITKIDAAATKINADSIEDGTANKVYPAADQTKVAGVEAGATADQTGDEMVTAIDGGSTGITREGAVDAASMKLIKTNPAVGEFPVEAVHRQVGGELDIEYSDIAQT